MIIIDFYFLVHPQLSENVVCGFVDDEGGVRIMQIVAARMMGECF